MELKYLIFSMLFVTLAAKAISYEEKDSQIPYTSACSTNASSAYVDIILLIDTSTNMGAANLRKISSTMSLILPKFTIGQQSDITQGYKNTRVAVISYNTHATIVANFTSINSVSDVSTILNSLSVSSSSVANIAEAMSLAFFIQTNCTNVENCLSVEYRVYLRPTATILFAAGADMSQYKVVQDLSGDISYWDGTLIGVNFNSANQDLTNILNMATFNNLVNASMYNYLSTRNTLTQDLEWAILQANCYCSSAFGVSTVYFDSANNRYAKYAECMYLMVLNQDELYPVNSIEMCADLPLQIIPGFVVSQLQQNFVQNLVLDAVGAYPVYFGLHKDKQSNWAYYNYDLTEIQVSNYSNWGSGYPNGADRCGALNYDTSWQSIPCDYTQVQYDIGLCQHKACDAESLDCCKACMFGGDVKEKTRKQKKYVKIHK